MSANLNSGGKIRVTTPSASGGSLPSGIVCAWFLSETPPSGFVACNGANGTDDLRGKFLRGTPVGGTTGVTGGTSAHLHQGGSHAHGSGTLTATHGHTHTLQMPAHTHGVEVCLTLSYTNAGCGAGVCVVTNVVVDTASACSCGPTDLVGDINPCSAPVTGATDMAGDVDTTEVDHLPPYEDVLWIMKV